MKKKQESDLSQNEPLCHIAGTVHDMQSLVQASRSEVRKKVNEFGGPDKFINLIAPRLAANAPANLQLEVLQEHSVDWYSDADRRIGQCAHCPEHGGACAHEEDSRLGPGLQPLWSAGHLMATECDRWSTYREVTRLLDSGVPERFAARAAIDFPDVGMGVREKLSEVIGNPRAVVLNVRSALPDRGRRVAIAALWGILHTRRRIWARYVLGAKLMEQAKLFHGRYVDDPFEELERCTVLLIDGLTTELPPDWWTQRIGLLAYERWANGLCTVIVSDSKTDLDQVYPMLSQVHRSSWREVSLNP